MPIFDRRSLLTLLAAGAATLAPSLAAADDEDEVPNLFISPHGEPFRAAAGAPYPIADWFRQADKDSDGKLTRAEFVDDAEGFFKKLDLNGDGALSHFEISVYERKVCPEILAGGIHLSQTEGGRLWLAQYGSPVPGSASAHAPIDPGGDGPDPNAPPHRRTLDESGQGAAPFSLFDEPEPVMTADFNVNGIITRDNFLKVADMHFAALDTGAKGYLTLPGLPQTKVEKALHKNHGHGRS